MQRAIVDFHQDEQGLWIAELACGHRRHVHHRPPFESRPWVLDAAGRRQRLGTPIECGRCDQEVPAPPSSAARAGGEPACLAHLLCPSCGAVLDGGAHRPGCTGEE